MVVEEHSFLLWIYVVEDLLSERGPEGQSLEGRNHFEMNEKPPTESVESL